LLRLLGGDQAERSLASAALARCSPVENRLKQGLQGEGGLGGAYHAWQLSVGLGCTKGAEGAGHLEDLAAAALDPALQEGSLASLYYPVLVLTALGSPALDVPAIVEAIRDAQDDDGRMYDSHDDAGPPASKHNHLALEMLEAMLPAIQKEGGEVLDMATTVVAASISYLLPTGSNGDVADGTMVRFQALAKGLGVAGLASFKAKQMRAIIGELVAVKHSECVSFAVKVVEAFRVMAGLKAAPAVLSLVQSSLAAGDAQGNVEIKATVTNLLGDALPGAVTVKLSSVSRGGGVGDQLAQKLELQPGADGTAFSVKTALDPNSYVAEFEVSAPEALSSTVKFRKRVAVTAPITLQDPRLTVSHSRSPAEGTTYQGQLPSGVSANGLEGHWVHLQFQVASAAPASSPAAAQAPALVPHQAFVRFHHVESGVDTFFVAQPLRGAGEEDEDEDEEGLDLDQTVGGSLVAAHLNVAEESESFQHRSGEYEVFLLAGDGVVTEAQEVPLGSLHLTVIAEKVREWPLYSRALLHDSDVALAPLPEIQHTFRQPDARPAKVVSALFTLGVGALQLVLLGGLQRAGANLTTLPSGGASLIVAVGFQGCLGAILALFGVYWLRLTMAHCLTILLPLAIVTMFFGHKALKDQASIRMLKPTKGKVE